MFEGVGERPVLSINRGFSAPVIVETDRGAGRPRLPLGARRRSLRPLRGDAATDARHPARARSPTGAADHGPVIEAVRETLTDPALDPAFIAEAVLLPSEAFIGDQMDDGRSRGDPSRARGAARRARARSSEPLWRAAYASTAANRYEYQPGRQGRAAAADGRARLSDGGGRGRRGRRCAERQFDEADNMTDRQGALGVLANSDAPERDGGARRLLRALSGQCAGARQMVHARRRSRPATTRRRRSRRWPGIPISRWPTRTGCARWSAPSRPTSAPSTTPRGAATASSPT